LITLAIFLPLALIAAGVGAMFLTSRAIKPIGELRDAASRISEANLSERLTVEGNDEFAELGQTFNQMVDRLETSFVDLKEAYEHQRRFTADASHELRTPLTRINLATSAALQGSSDMEALRRALLVANEAGEGMSRLVGQLLLLAKADAGQLGVHRERTDLRVIASEAIEQTPNPDGVPISTNFPKGAVYAEVDPDAIRRVVVNLLENAFRYADGQPVEVAVSTSPAIRVTDRGKGIAPQHLAHLTERFYRADDSRTEATGGSGLGLAICRAIMEAHEGSLAIASEIGSGTSVEAEFSKKSENAPIQTSSS
jgi:two-component system OmpR family sensor kinase